MIIISFKIKENRLEKRGFYFLVNIIPETREVSITVQDSNTTEKTTLINFTDKRTQMRPISEFFYIKSTKAKYIASKYIQIRKNYYICLNIRQKKQ